MQTTTNYKLKKPDLTDVVDIQNFNDNADIIDSELSKRALKTDIKVTSVAGRTGAVTLSKSDVGLGSVNNWGASTAVNNTSTTTYATASAVKQAYDKAEAAFQSASNGKSKIAAAITGKGVTTSASDTFDKMAANISNINTGVPINGTLMTGAAAENINKGDFVQFTNGAEVSITDNICPGVPLGNEHFMMFDASTKSACVYKLSGNIFTKITEKVLYGSEISSNCTLEDIVKYNDNIVFTLTGNDTSKVAYVYCYLVTIDSSYNITLQSSITINTGIVTTFTSDFICDTCQCVSNNRLAIGLSINDRLYICIVTISGTNLIYSKLINLDTNAYGSIKFTSNNKNILFLCADSYGDTKCCYITLYDDNTVKIAKGSKRYSGDPGLYGTVCLNDLQFILLCRASNSNGDAYTTLYYDIYSFTTDGTYNTISSKSMSYGYSDDYTTGHTIKITGNNYFITANGGKYSTHCGYYSLDPNTGVFSRLDTSSSSTTRVYSPQKYSCKAFGEVLMLSGKEYGKNTIQFIQFINNKIQKYTSKSIKRYAGTINGVAATSATTGNTVSVYSI